MTPVRRVRGTGQGLSHEKRGDFGLVHKQSGRYYNDMTPHFTLAHLSDVHLGPLPRLPLRHCNVKRVLGFLNWHRNRKAAHLRSTLDLLVADLAAQSPDHIAVTGDLVNIGLPAEYAAAASWLGRLGSPERVTVVPGNHDIYTHLRGDPGIERWRAYMLPDAAGAALVAPWSGSFPFVRRFGRITLIGLNSAVPTPPFYAGGRLGAAQREQLADILAKLGIEGGLRVVLIHHPPLPGQALRQKALEDAGELAAILARHGAELVLHGHNHRSMYAEQPTTGCDDPLGNSPEGTVSVVGVPSASLGRPHTGENLARYHLFRLPGEGGPIEMVARGLAEPGGAIVEIERRLLGACPSRRLLRRCESEFFPGS